MKKFFRIYFLLCVMLFLFVKNVVSQRTGSLSFETRAFLYDTMPSAISYNSDFPTVFMNVSEAHGFNTRMYVYPAQLYPGSTLSLDNNRYGMIDHGKIQSYADDFSELITWFGYYGPAPDNTACAPMHGGVQVKTPESKWTDKVGINLSPWQMINYSLTQEGKILSNQKSGFFWDDYVYCSYDQMGVKLKKEELPGYTSLFPIGLLNSHNDIIVFERRGRLNGDAPISFHQVNNQGGIDWHIYASMYTCLGSDGVGAIRNLPYTFNEFYNLWYSRIAYCLYDKGKISNY